MRIIKKFRENEVERVIRGGAYKAQYTVIENAHRLTDAARESGDDKIEKYWEDISEMTESLYYISGELEAMGDNPDLAKLEEIKKMIGTI
jgi:hypothetical protein